MNRVRVHVDQDLARLHGPEIRWLLETALIGLGRPWHHVADPADGCDLAYVPRARAGIVPRDVLAAVRETVNAHPGRLPDYRGLDAPLWALADGEPSAVGSTLHLVDEGIDTGAIVEWKPYVWRGDERVGTIERMVYEDCLDLLLEATRWPEPLKGRPQGDGQYRHKLPRRLLPIARRQLAEHLSAR